MAAEVNIDNPLVSSFSAQVSLNQKVSISNFVLVTSLSTRFSGAIMICNVSAQASTQPITGNTISFYRNGYLYDQSSFSFQANPATISNVSLLLANDNANTVTNLTISFNFSVGVSANDFLYIQLPQAITVYNCSVVSCNTCTCSLNKANLAIGLLYTTIKITSFNNLTLTTNLNVLINIKNPITSNYTLQFTTTDINNYTKEVGS